MSSTAAIEPVGTGYKPFNFEQVDYVMVGRGATPVTYESVISLVTVERAESIEAEAMVLVKVVRKRSKKVEELGTVMGHVTAAQMNFTSKSKGSDTQPVTDGAYCNAVLNQYSVTNYMSGNSISKDNAQKQQAALQQATDLESNQLQQDNVTLQSYLDKRGQAFSMAAKLSMKVNDQRSRAIKDIQ